MIRINLQTATEKISNETNCTKAIAEKMAHQLQHVNEALSPCVEAWLIGEEIDFTFNTIALSEIIEKEKTPYVHAIFRMSTLIDNPEWVEHYKTRRFRRK